MKTISILKKIGLLSILFSLLWSCTDEDNTQYNKGNQLLEVSASKDEVTLDALNPNSEAVKFTWTTGTNNGTGLAINYTFQLDKEGGNFENGVSVEIGRNIYELSYKNEELNEIYINKFGLEPMTEAAFQYRIVANVASEDIAAQASPVKNIKIKSHKPITKTLYIVGDATANGWDAGKATEMTAVTNTPKAFTWTGFLKAGEFKFITTLGSLLPSYHKAKDDFSLVLRESESDTDNKFTITEGGTYTINVNLITLAINVTKKEGPEYSQLWFVGNATNWEFKEMTVDALDPFVFHYNDDLSKGGEFKIGTTTDFTTASFYRPSVDKTGAGTNLKVEKWAGDPDNKWNIAGGTYKIKLDIRDMLIDIVPFKPFATAYLIGDAAPSGWDIANATPMTVSGDYKFVWAGTLNTGELKITLDRQGDWNGAWFIASAADKQPTGYSEQVIFSNPGAGVDYKWKITEAGTYNIELDQLKETIIIKKQ